MGLDDLLKFALTGENAVVLGMLGVIAFFCTRVVQIANTWAYGGTAGAAGVLGAMGAFAEALSKAGPDPIVLPRAAAIGFIVTSGGALLVGATLSKVLDTAGVWPISDDKKLHEAVRDPLDLTEPSALPQHQAEAKAKRQGGGTT